MSGTWGNNIKYTIFGESHGPGIGIVIDNLPPGLKLDVEFIHSEMARRKPGSSNLTTSRAEADELELLSGCFEGRTTGAPLCAFIRNTNQASKDYDKIKDLARPGHADFTGYIKYKGFNDYRGGGHFSGRLTAALVFAGAIAKQLLDQERISITSHIYRIGSIQDSSFADKIHDIDFLSYLKQQQMPVIDEQAGRMMAQAIQEAKESGDSIGGIVETAILNLPVGLGEPFFDSLESIIAHLVFSIPGAKGIEFGDGFALAEMRGSEANDSFINEDGRVSTKTNHSGGILGGISNGMPLVFRTAFKPTSSIAKEQQTVRLSTGEHASIRIEGRHDPCIVTRALLVVEAAAAMAILDCLSSSPRIGGQR